MSRTLKNRVEDARRVAEAFLELTDEQQRDICTKMLIMKIKNKVETGLTTYEREKDFLGFVSAYFKEATEDEKTEAIAKIQEISTRRRKEPNAIIKLKLSV